MAEVGTMEGLLDVLREQMPAFTEDGLTTKEFSLALGLSENAVRRRLAHLKAAGLIEVVLKKVATLNGRVTSATAWRLA